MRVLLDTETFSIATMDGLPALPKKVRSLLTEDETDLWISATTILEIAKKHGTGKMLFNEELVRKGAVDLRLTIIPYEPRHAYKLFALPHRHRDPFDRCADGALETVAHLSAVGLRDRQFGELSEGRGGAG